MNRSLAYSPSMSDYDTDKDEKISKLNVRLLEEKIKLLQMQSSRSSSSSRYSTPETSSFETLSFRKPIQNVQHVEHMQHMQHMQYMQPIQNMQQMQQMQQIQDMQQAKTINDPKEINKNIIDLQNKYYDVKDQNIEQKKLIDNLTDEINKIREEFINFKQTHEKQNAEQKKLIDNLVNEISKIQVVQVVQVVQVDQAVQAVQADLDQAVQAVQADLDQAVQIVQDQAVQIVQDQAVQIVQDQVVQDQIVQDQIVQVVQFFQAVPAVPDVQDQAVQDQAVLAVPDITSDEILARLEQERLERLEQFEQKNEDVSENYYTDDDYEEYEHEQPKYVVESSFDVSFNGSNIIETINSIEAGKKKYNPESKFLFIQTNVSGLSVITWNDDYKYSTADTRVSDKWITRDIDDSEEKIQKKIKNALPSILPNLYIPNTKGSKIIFCYIDRSKINYPKYHFIRMVL